MAMVSKTSTATKKRPTAAKKSAPRKKTTTAKKRSEKVDIYPNRMTVAISALAGTLLILVTIIAVLGSRG